MSLWPDGDLKQDHAYITSHLVGVSGSLVFHHDLDKFYEHEKIPSIYSIDWTDDSSSLMKKIDENYENMLNYNDITPDRVTLSAAEELIDQKKRPEISLNKTRYSFRGHNFYTNEFYKYQQSCTTFAMALLLNSGINDEFQNYILKKNSDNFKLEDFFDNILDPIFNPFIKDIELLKIVDVKTFRTFLNNKFETPKNADCVII